MSVFFLLIPSRAKKLNIASLVVIVFRMLSRLRESLAGTLARSVFYYDMLCFFYPGLGARANDV